MRVGSGSFEKIFLIKTLSRFKDFISKKNSLVKQWNESSETSK
jgi:hypothetical protein